jgi:hypothetical protein
MGASAEARKLFAATVAVHLAPSIVDVLAENANTFDRVYHGSGDRAVLPADYRVLPIVYRIEVEVEGNKGMLPKRSIQCGFRVFNRDAEAISNTVGRLVQL